MAGSSWSNVQAAQDVKSLAGGNAADSVAEFDNPVSQSHSISFPMFRSPCGSEYGGSALHSSPFPCLTQMVYHFG